MIALTELSDNDFDVLLAGAGEEKFLGLRVAGKTQRGVFLHNFMNGDADFVFIGARFRLDRKGNGRFGELRG